ncbi:MAG: 4-aminobutyrate--2-oxoglutarate transaminase [Thermoleophilia bacterium]|nr:4-aminobutyrate--2-oxoglutarate transaminase [Thermoleophilia bacterium]
MTNAELGALKSATVPTSVASPPLYVARARNAYMWDVEGRRYIDFASGIAVVNVGHSHPKVVEAVKEQAELFSHTCFGVAGYEPYLRLADRLNNLVPGDFAKRTFFINSGAEAVENAVKIARYVTRRRSVVAFENGFHGRTYMALSLTSQVDPYKKGFGPYASDVYRVPYAYCYRCPLGLTYPGCECECASLLEDAFAAHVDPSDVAAVVIEPVVGEGGIIVPPMEYLQKIRDLCRKHEILLIADEIQTGIGRTGKWFALEHFGVAADLVTTAKALGAGLPISAVTGRQDIMDAVHTGGVGTTFGGNPLACRAGLAVFEVIESERLLQRAAEIGNRACMRLRQMQERFSCIGDVRCLGAMVGIELVEDPTTKKPAAELAKNYRAKLCENGLLTVGAGIHHNVVRVLPPLTIEDSVLEEGLDIMEETLAALVRTGQA